MNHLGIDPGASGGLTVLSHNGEVIDSVKMPDTEADILALIREWARLHAPLRARLEFVRSSPQMGVTSSFTFGMGYGGLRMALLACGVPFEEVTPPKWQGALGCRSKGDKNVTKRKAQEMWPSRRWTHATADSALIAEYGRRAR